MTYSFNNISRLKSEKNSIAQIEPILLNLKDKFDIQDECFYNIMIAVTEAVNNAINHGNKLNPLKGIDFVIHANSEEVLIIVRDEGEGFNPDNVENCLDPKNLLKSSGRGVFLIKELMDDVIIRSTSDGTEVTMRYSLA